VTEVEGHRVVWALVTGEWPTGEIDHVDGDRANNIFPNLRQASRRENMQNLGKQARNTSGHVGAFWSKSKGRWSSRICTEDGVVFLGYFDSAEAAGAAYAAAKKVYHPFQPTVRQ
jgi:HNH endonuclease